MLLGIVMRRITKSSELSRSKASQYSHTNTLFCPPWAFQKGKVCLYQIYSTNGGFILSALIEELDKEIKKNPPFVE